MSDDARVADAAWEAIVRNVPLVSVDLVVTCDDGVVLGKRTNRPARGEWFVPGGTVRKNERLTEAVDRIADAELGVAVEIDERLGVYEHFYDTSDVDGVDSKHYVAIGYAVTPASTEFTGDDQHEELKAFSTLPSDLHPYVRAYLEDADVVS